MYTCFIRTEARHGDPALPSDLAPSGAAGPGLRLGPALLEALGEERTPMTTTTAKRIIRQRCKGCRQLVESTYQPSGYCEECYRTRCKCGALRPSGLKQCYHCLRAQERATRLERGE